MSAVFGRTSRSQSTRDAEAVQALRFSLEEITKKLSEKEMALAQLADLHARLLNTNEELTAKLEERQASPVDWKKTSVNIQRGSDASLATADTPGDPQCVTPIAGGGVPEHDGNSADREDLARHLEHENIVSELADLKLRHVAMAARAEDAERHLADASLTISSLRERAEAAEALASTSSTITATASASTSAFDAGPTEEVECQLRVAHTRISELEAQLDAYKAVTAQPEDVADSDGVQSRDATVDALESKLRAALEEVGAYKAKAEEAMVQTRAAQEAVEAAKQELAELRNAEEMSKRKLAAEMWAAREAHHKDVERYEADLASERAKLTRLRAELQGVRSRAASIDMGNTENAEAPAAAPVALPQPAGGASSDAVGNVGWDEV